MYRSHNCADNGFSEAIYAMHLERVYDRLFCAVRTVIFVHTVVDF